MKKLKSGQFICIWCRFKETKKCEMPKELENWIIKPYVRKGKGYEIIER